MVDIILTLKHRARLFHRELAKGNPMDLARLNRRLAKPHTDPALVRRRDCLTMLAREQGFRSWSHLLGVIRDKSVSDFGTLLYPDRCYAHFNIWSADINEARRIRSETNGYLLGYKKQFFVVDRDYVATLGLDPEDPDWQPLERDVTHPAHANARGRLISRLLHKNLSVAR
ncbi:hypothetical protein [Aestuariispira insulae]|uniref:Uncharacterized protein n=1 Tax=Aestuariispira insulae TaxID=1461337 RepID=A0A3D9HW85_9PROT|nr:hypothetical protein [Aestuariispira insulae]RED53773.1 hypothetical protein DFP90_101572 [Aestuariispira insulae]